MSLNGWEFKRLRKRAATESSSFRVMFMGGSSGVTLRARSMSAIAWLQQHGRSLQWQPMRKASGIAFISLGSIGLAICGIVLLHLPLPIPGFLLQRIGDFAIVVDPLRAPVWSVLFLTTGIVLVSRGKRALRIGAIAVGVIAGLYLLLIIFMPDWMIVGIRFRWPWK